MELAPRKPGGPPSRRRRLFYPAPQTKRQPPRLILLWRGGYSGDWLGPPFLADCDGDHGAILAIVLQGRGCGASSLLQPAPVLLVASTIATEAERYEC
jgi:hypothetical protein